MSNENTLFIPEQKTPHFYMPAHTITWKRNFDALKKEMASSDFHRFFELVNSVGKRNKQAKKELEYFLTHYPTQPEVLNLKAYFFLLRKKVKQADKIIEKNYELNGENLFAKINYADLCMRKKRFHMVPEIFKHVLYLKDLYPEKNAFYVSAFRGFMVVMGLYFLEIKQKEKAICYHYLAYKVDKEHPSVKILGRKIYKVPFLQKIFKNFK